MNNSFNLWAYLAASPLLGVSITLGGYLLGIKLYRLGKGSPLFSPVLIAILLIILYLSFSQTPYSNYFEGAKFIHFFLGPATVALAIPLYKELKNICKLLIPISISLFVGVIVGAYSSIIIAKLLGANREVIISLIPKSVTSPVAMSISENIGGVPALTVAFVVFTGIIGAVFGEFVFRLIKIDNHQAMGMAMGCSAHGVGTAQAFLISNQMGAFSGLAMTLMAIFSSLIIPYLTRITNI